MTKPKERRERRNFTPEFKQDAVKMVLLEGISTTRAAEKLGIDRSNLERWKKSHLEQMGGLQGSGSGLNGPGMSMTAKEMDVEIRTLRKQLRESEMQREILKKALGIFSREAVSGINS